MSDKLRGGTTIGGYLATHNGNIKSIIAGSGDVTFTGTVTAAGYDTSSDATLKNIKSIYDNATAKDRKSVV